MHCLLWELCSAFPGYGSRTGGEPFPGFRFKAGGMTAQADDGEAPEGSLDAMSDEEVLFEL